MDSKSYYKFDDRMYFAANVAPATISNPEHNKSIRRL